MDVQFNEPRLHVARTQRLSLQETMVARRIVQTTTQATVLLVIIGFTCLVIAVAIIRSSFSEPSPPDPQDFIGM